MIRRNYTKTFNGFKNRILFKIMALTVVQLVSKQNNKNINNFEDAYCLINALRVGLFIFYCFSKIAYVLKEHPVNRSTKVSEYCVFSYL